MKRLAFYLSILLLAIETSLGGINDELVSLFSARHAAAMVPAKEGRIADVDPWMDDKTSGMIFDPKNAFSLERESFEKALSSAQIQAWTLAQEAPWSPGKQSSWVVLDYGGQPFLSITLTEDQPELIRVRQVIRFSEGVATLGRAQLVIFDVS